VRFKNLRVMHTMRMPSYARSETFKTSSKHVWEALLSGVYRTISCSRNRL